MDHPVHFLSQCRTAPREASSLAAPQAEEPWWESQVPAAKGERRSRCCGPGAGQPPTSSSRARAGGLRSVPPAEGYGDRTAGHRDSSATGVLTQGHPAAVESGPRHALGRALGVKVTLAGRAAARSGRRRRDFLLPSCG